MAMTTFATDPELAEETHEQAVQELRVHAVDDELLARLGHRIDSPYVQTYWLPIIGPSTWCLAQLLDRSVGHDEVTFRLDHLAVQLGLGAGTAKHSPVVRTVQRAERFGILTALPSGSHALRRHLSPLPARHLRRLPAFLQALHDQEVAP